MQLTLEDLAMRFSNAANIRAVILTHLWYYVLRMTSVLISADNHAASGGIALCHVKITKL